MSGVCLVHTRGPPFPPRDVEAVEGAPPWSWRCHCTGTQAFSFCFFCICPQWIPHRTCNVRRLPTAEVIWLKVRRTTRWVFLGSSSACRNRIAAPVRCGVSSCPWKTEISAVGSSGRVSKRLWCQSLKGDLAPALIIVFLPSTQKHRVNSLVRLEQNDGHQRRQQVAKSWVLRLTAAASPGPGVRPAAREIQNKKLQLQLSSATATNNRD
jgi:hypothetical protein